MPEVGLPIHIVETIYDLITLASDELPQKAQELPALQFVDYILDRTGYTRWMEAVATRLVADAGALALPGAVVDRLLDWEG